MDIVKALPFIVVLAVCSRAANAQIDDYWDAEKDWTSHFGPCRSHFMFKFSPCEPKTKMLACCRRFNPFVLFLLMVLSLTAVATVPILMLCCICPPWRILCECCLCCRCCAIDENGNFIYFMEDEEKTTEDFDIKTEEQSSIRSRMETISKK
uniref:Caveolin n=1 Tax=Wuchereria bancrofti TaxID=6293 RepID=A0AAF5RXD3_WUCBA